MARYDSSLTFSTLVMKLLTLSASALLLLVGETASRGDQSDNPCQGLDQNVVALIGQYKELRERRRQLPAGTYDKELRDHGGKLHRILESLGRELGHPPHAKKIIIKCLGTPDAVKNDAQMARFLEIYERERRKAGRPPRPKREREYLIYHWRGGHDFMFFISEGGLIVDHGWWFAYE